MGETSFTIVACVTIVVAGAILSLLITTPPAPVCWTFESATPRTCVKPRGQLNSGACFPTGKEAADFATSQRLKICGAAVP